MIICENLSKTFGSNTAIKNVNLKFMPGIIYGIIGYNGAGKTTLFNCIEGLYIPASGFVSHNDIKTTNEKDFLPYRRNIAFLPNEDYLYPNLTCMENIELAVILKTGKNKIPNETNELIRYLETENYLNKKFKECSTGMKKKVQMIISLIGEIDTIIWDEPNNGLDIVSNIKVKNLINHYKSKNATILFSSHVIEFLENFVDHCILLHKGEVIENNDIKNIGSLEKLFLKNLPESDFKF
ncbi:MAG: ABC transporter ATP-binding protein [Treponema sp.]|nr:ABC transporter ATP-binding protein [Treponema sp.]MCL2251316.1 ABC transporter ATP-binding protein [Treponema sp.]